MGKDYQPTYGQRHDQYRAGERTGDIQARIAHAVVASQRFPFLGPEHEASLTVEPLPGNGGTWFFVNAIAAGTMFGNPDPRIIPPDQQRYLIEKLKAEGSLLASGQFGRPGLTTVPREDEERLAAMYRAQLTGNGSGSKDITGYFALGQLPEVTVRSQKTGQEVPAVAVVGAKLTRNSEIGEAYRKLERMGYPQREGPKKTKTNRRR